MTRLHTALLLLWTCAIGLSLHSCANPGTGPDGGPFDETPPSIVAISPAQGTTSVGKKQKIIITFSEPIAVENISEKVTVSPPQQDVPEVKVNGRRISVQLQDTLRENTTYTIDFSDAITDATEKNPLGNFTYYFSTGEQIDTMEVAGNVVDAETLEPVKGALVGLYSSMEDSLFFSKPFERVARTDDDGHFSIKGVAPGTYRVYALADMDGDFKYTRGERLAFLEEAITPSAYPDIRFDTIWADSVRYDSVRTIHYTHFKPDDLVMRFYQEPNAIKGLTKFNRERPERMTAVFSGTPSKRPEIKGINFDATDAFVEDACETGDTIIYWLKSKDLALNDTLQFLYTYEATNDSTYALELRTDTMELVPRLSNARIKKLEEEAQKTWEKELARRHKRGDFSQETRPPETIELKAATGTSITPLQNLVFTAEEPIMQVDTSHIHLTLVTDSTQTPAPYRILKPRLKEFTLMAEWRPGQSYKLVMDSLCATALSGKNTRGLTQAIHVTTNEEVGSIFLTIPDADSTAVVELIKSATSVERRVKVENQRADFFYIVPGTYYVRCFFDRNGDGKWSSGRAEPLEQPEEMYYFPTGIEVRANWDIDQTWKLTERSLLKQKPAKMQTKKSKQKKQTGHEKNIQRQQQKQKSK
ncbi:MAG: Ig-like domain-containing protein [Alloprevotella sp.]|nr:Ig-like domain-containing protein [Alloprevotella sp.]